jgi:GNAT superfamily N-acetyltransferase
MPPAPEPFVTRLRDGTWVKIRALEPDDRDAMKEGFTHVGGRSRYERFLSPSHELTERELDYLTHPDQRDHLALALTTLDEPPEGIGVARCIRDAPGAASAEYAILIRDDYQGRGAGPLLLAHLAELALERGIATFRGIQLADNLRILKITEKLATMIARMPCDPGVLEVIWQLDPAAVRAHLGRRREPPSRLRVSLERLASRLSRARGPSAGTRR